MSGSLTGLDTGCWPARCSTPAINTVFAVRVRRSGLMSGTPMKPKSPSQFHAAESREAV